jgi:glycosyltransferase involved in cell wall biosynthesis
LGNNISPKYIDIELKIDSAFLNKWNLEKGEYFISVSTVEPRKNFKYLLNVFFELLKLNPSLKLVLVGRKGWGNDNELKMLINKLEKSLIFTDYVSDEELISLYHYSKAFFLLSIYEGFGRTPIEALACGCKNIFVSDIPVFRETMNGQAEFLPLDSIQDCVEIINRHDFSSNKNANLQIPFNILGQNVKENIHTLLK